MADWKDKFREGSFRGIPFKIETAQKQGGRRKQDREFAKRDLGNSEDLGRRLRKFTLEMLLIGDDYFAQRDALEEALEGEGPGELIHPYRGTLRVQAGNYTAVESKTEGRTIRITAEFTEAGLVKFPAQVQDDLTATINNAGNLIDSSKGFFETIFSVANQPAFVLESAADALTSVLDFAESAVASVTQPVTDFAFAIRNIKAAVDDLIKAPGELADRLQASFDLLLAEFTDTPETSERIFGQFGSVGDDLEDVIGNTHSKIKVQGNQDALLNLTKELALGNQSKAAVDVDFPSTNAALQSRNAIVKGLDQQALGADDDLFQAIKELETFLTRAIPRTGATELITIEVKKTIPALIIAHDNFEDLDKESEIIDQNNIEHPGFVPGGDDIQVSAG